MKIKKLALVLAASASVVGLSAIGGTINNNPNITPQVLAASVETSSQVSFSSVAGDLEALYAEFNPVANANGYNAYVKLDSASTFTKLDSQLVRTYNDGHIRVDAVGLAEGTYTLKVVPVINDAEDTSKQAQKTGIVVKAHDRSGFAFSDASPNGGEASGAYNADGTLKSNARVIYVTAANAKTVTCDVITSSKGAVETFTGMQQIIYGYSKGYDTTPITFRIIGTIKYSDMDTLLSSEEGLQIKGKSADSAMNMTIEGIGNDAGIHGFGMLIRNCSNVELRNFAVMNCLDDSISIDTDNSNLWVHNLDLFYGQTGSDSDQAKGDGTIDIKKSQYVTVSYNHYWDSGKASLLDASVLSSNYVDNITMHHNWFDHSDSRHPRTRNGQSFHIYNNYYDGNAKYGIGCSGGSSVFSEANYFRNCKNPIMSAQQGTDAAAAKSTFSGETGGVVKSYNDYMTGSYSFIPYTSGAGLAYDAYVATSQKEVISSSITSASGKAYSNFDTASDMYSYTVDTPEVAKNNVETYAGRVQGGDFQYDFDDATEDSNYSVITELKDAIVNYTSSLASVQNLGEVSSGTSEESGSTETGNTETGETENPSTGETTETGENESSESGSTETGNTETAGLHVMTFTDNNTIDEAGYFTVTGNTSSSKGSVTYDGTTYSVCLKIESSTSINFTAGNAGKLTLVFDTPSKKVKVDGTSYTTDSNGILELELSAGAHTITKGDTMNLFYMSMNEEGASNNESEATTSVLLERQSSSNAIRYITTITGYAKSDIVSWNVTFNLNGTIVSTSNYSVLYLSVAGDNGKDSVENTYYLVFTMTDIPSSQNGNTLSCYMTITLSDNTTITTNTVSDVLSIQ